ncbi:MAG: amidohydrolase, partial [Bryobacteraceae bacterium]
MRAQSLLLLAALAAAASSAQVAVRGETVYTMAGPPIHDGVVVLRDGKVAAIGPAAQVSIPAGYRTLTAKVVTPGLVDAHTVVGLSGYLNQPQDQDQVERSAPMQPELRAIDAYDPSEPLIDWVRGFGVTTMHTGHGPGILISGQTMIVKTRGATAEEAVIVRSAMVAATIGEGARGQAGKSPGTRAKEIAMLRAEFVKAQEYGAKKDQPRDLRLETLERVVNGGMPLLVTVNRATDIISALRLAKEFHIRMVLDGAAEAYLVLDEIKASGYPVIVHPTMARSSGDTANLTMENAARLRAAGIPFALQSGYEAYVPKTRVILFEAGVAAANGLTREQALASITIDAARILGIDKRV